MPRQDVAIRLAALCADLRANAESFDPASLLCEFAEQVRFIRIDVQPGDHAWFAHEVAVARDDLIRFAGRTPAR